MAQRLVGCIGVSSKAGRDDDRFLSPELQRADMERWASGLAEHDRCERAAAGEREALGFGKVNESDALLKRAQHARSAPR